MLWHMLIMIKASLWIDDDPEFALWVEQNGTGTNHHSVYPVVYIPLEPGRYGSRFCISRPTWSVESKAS
jgi:hypothetical protein